MARLGRHKDKVREGNVRRVRSPTSALLWSVESGGVAKLVFARLSFFQP